MSINNYQITAEKLAEIARANHEEIISAKLYCREMLKLGMLAASGLLVAKSGSSRDAKATQLISSPTTPWLDPLPIPGTVPD